VSGRWFSGLSQHRRVQVAVAVEEAAIQPVLAGDREDADLRAQVGSLLERGEDPLPASAAVGLAAGGDGVVVTVAPEADWDRGGG